MLPYLLLFGATAIAVEIFLKTPMLSWVNDLTVTGQKSVHMVSSEKISDHWKEKVLLRYSGSIAVNTLKILFGMFIIFMPIILLCLFNTSVLSLTTAWSGIIATCLFGFAYAFIRRHFVK